MDAALLENGDGGDVQLINNDWAIVFGIENQPYLGMFSGNPGYPTPQQSTSTDENLDWWGNSLLMNGKESEQFNSLTEKILQEVALTSTGRSMIENTVKKDLEFMKPFAQVDVSVYLVSDDRLTIEIKITADNGSTTIKVVNYKRRTDQAGDFFFLDFNDDFFI